MNTHDGFVLLWGDLSSNRHLVTLCIDGQLLKSVVSANSAMHARLLCQYQFGMSCVHVAPKQLQGQQLKYPFMNDLKQLTCSTIKLRPPKTASIKPAKSPSPEQKQATQLNANVDR